jgi:class 3 adenylate cyclase/ABC-type sugar transport system permease subunit
MKLQKKYYFIIPSLLVLFVFVTFLFIKSTAIHFEDNEYFLSNLRHLQATDAIINQYLLRLRNGTLTNVDPINRALTTIKMLQHKLINQIPYFIEKTGQHRLTQQLNQFQQLMAHKELLIERFKAENANLQTSITYFPVITQEFIEKARTQSESQWFVTDLQRLLQDVLLYKLNANLIHQSSLYHQISQLQQALANDKGKLHQATIQNIITQVQTILRLKPTVDTLLKKLIFMPTTEQLEKISVDYNRYYEYALKTEAFYRMCLYMTCILLIIYIAWLIIQNLGERIREATFQIEQYAKELKISLENERRLSIEKEKMGAYISKQVVDEISRNREQTLALGGKTVYATILFADIKGFTKLSEIIDPHEVVQFLNIYMTAMTDIIENHHGIVDKFIGDGIMAVFTDSEGNNHALQAVQAGIDMQKKLLELRRQWNHSKSLFSELNIRIGINTGHVVAGNIGSKTRMDYTVIGDNVNLASRIEGVCHPGQVLISANTYQEVKHQITAKPMPPITVKNRVQPVYTYAIEI